MSRLEQIVEPLLAWYEKNARDLPWRHGVTPYRVWISEIMLQQTRVEAVKGILSGLCRRFRMWSRCRRLKKNVF